MFLWSVLAIGSSTAVNVGVHVSFEWGFFFFQYRLKCGYWNPRLSAFEIFHCCLWRLSFLGAIASSIGNSSRVPMEPWYVPFPQNISGCSIISRLSPPFNVCIQSGWPFCQMVIDHLLSLMIGIPMVIIGWASCPGRFGSFILYFFP